MVASTSASDACFVGAVSLVAGLISGPYTIHVIGKYFVYVGDYSLYNRRVESSCGAALTSSYSPVQALCFGGTASSTITARKLIMATMAMMAIQELVVRIQPQVPMQGLGLITNQPFLAVYF